MDFLEAIGLKAKRTGIHAPWQKTELPKDGLEACP
jgi:hypothetical protein